MRNTNKTRTNGNDLGHRQDRRFDAVRCAGNPRLAEVLSRGAESERLLRKPLSSKQYALALGSLQSVAQGMAGMGAVLMGQPILGQSIVGKRRLATCPVVKRPVAERFVAQRLSGAHRGATTPWRLVLDRGESAKPVVHSTIRNS